MSSDRRVVADEGVRQGFETPIAHLQTSDILVAQKHPLKPLEVAANGALLSLTLSPSLNHERQKAVRWEIAQAHYRYRCRNDIQRRVVQVFFFPSTLQARRSCTSRSILDPGQVPQVCGVNRSVHPKELLSPKLSFPRFPAQEHAGGDSKIPSVLLYDKSGNVRAAGAETLQEDMMELAIDEGWFKSEWCVVMYFPVNRC